MSDGVYLKYDPDELWQGMQETYVACGGDILYPGDPVEIGLRAALAMSVQLLASVENRIRSRTLRHAQGENLEELGEDRSCPVIADSAASGRVEMHFKATGMARTIAAGEMMTADGVRFYATVDDIILTGYEQSVGAKIECTQAGSLGNGIAEGTQMQLVKNDASLSSITVIEAISGGNDREDDESYRARIQSDNMRSVTTGPSGAYEALALGVSSEILDARTLNDGPCAVCTYLVFADGADKDSLIQQVLAAQNPKDKRPLDDQVSAVEATERSYTLNISFALPDSATAQTAQAVADAVSDYQTQQDKVLGMAFNPEILVAKLYTAGATRVIIGEGSTFNGGAAQYTQIPEEEYCRGSVNMHQLDA